MKLLPVAIDLLNGKARSELVGLTTKVKFTTAFVLCAVISAIFLVVGATVLLANEIGTVYACFTMSAFFASMALVVLLLQNRARRKRQIKRVEAMAIASSAESSSAAGTMVLAQAFLRGFLNGKP